MTNPRSWFNLAKVNYLIYITFFFIYSNEMSNFNGSTSPSPWPIQNNPNTGERSIWNTQNTLFDFSSLPLNNPPMPNNGWQNLNGLSLTDSPWKNNTNGLQVQPTVNKLNNKLSSVHGNCKFRTCCVHKLFFCFYFDIQNNFAIFNY